MDSAALERRLLVARSYEEWVTALADVFTAHDLVFGHGTDNAGDEAFWLVRHAHAWDDTAWQRPPDPALIPGVVAVARRRIEERTPLAYLLGEAWFAGLRFVVDERVLVPRSPLAEVIERGFAPWCALAAGDRVLDIGTGSGCLAIAIAVYWPDVAVDATDVSAAALEVARDNAARHNVSARVRLFEADLFPRGGGPYRVIISNPPYVPSAELGRLPPEYRHEPSVALDSGATGLREVERILRRAARHLTPDGALFVDVGGQGQAVTAAYPALPLIWLEFERGGDGVFVVGAADLARALPGGAGASG